MAVRASELPSSALLNTNGPGLEKLQGVTRLGAGEGVLFYSLGEKSKGWAEPKDGISREAKEKK